MQSVIGNMIADSLQLGLNNATRLLAGVNASQFARWAARGGEVVRSHAGASGVGPLSMDSTACSSVSSRAVAGKVKRARAAMTSGRSRRMRIPQES